MKASLYPTLKKSYKWKKNMIMWCTRRDDKTLDFEKKEEGLEVSFP